VLKISRQQIAAYVSVRISGGSSVALANKMARQIWAMLTKNEDYRDLALAVATW